METISDINHIPSCEIGKVIDDHSVLSLLNYRGITVLEPGSDIPLCCARECWVIVANHFKGDTIFNWYIIHGFAHDDTGNFHLSSSQRWERTIRTVAGWGEKLSSEEARKMLLLYGITIKAPYRD